MGSKKGKNDSDRPAVTLRCQAGTTRGVDHSVRDDEIIGGVIPPIKGTLTAAKQHQAELCQLAEETFANLGLALPNVHQFLLSFNGQLRESRLNDNRCQQELAGTITRPVIAMAQKIIDLDAAAQTHEHLAVRVMQADQAISDGQRYFIKLVGAFTMLLEDVVALNQADRHTRDETEQALDEIKRIVTQATVVAEELTKAERTADTALRRTARQLRESDAELSTASSLEQRWEEIGSQWQTVIQKRTQLNDLQTRYDEATKLFWEKNRELQSYRGQWRDKHGQVEKARMLFDLAQLDPFCFVPNMTAEDILETAEDAVRQQLINAQPGRFPETFDGGIETRYQGVERDLLAAIAELTQPKPASPAPSAKAISPSTPPAESAATPKARPLHVMVVACASVAEPIDRQSIVQLLLQQDLASGSQHHELNAAIDEAISRGLIDVDKYDKIKTSLNGSRTAQGTGWYTKVHPDLARLVRETTGKVKVT